MIHAHDACEPRLQRPLKSRCPSPITGGIAVGQARAINGDVIVALSCRAVPIIEPAEHIEHPEAT